MRTLLNGGPGRHPSPTRRDVVEALALLHGGPVSEGPLALRVAEVMGVDTSGCSGAYDLRSRISWHGYRRCLREMTSDGLLVMRTQHQWWELAGGSLYSGMRGSATRAYATAATADALMDTVGRSELDPEAALRQLALRWARDRVLAENSAVVEAYALEWLDRQTADRAEDQP